MSSKADPTSFDKGRWGVDTKKETYSEEVFVIAVPDDMAKMIDSFQDGTAFGNMRVIEGSSAITLNTDVMERHGFSSDSYSSVYPLTMNEGSKYIRLFRDCPQDKKVYFEGSSPGVLTANTKKQSKQFRETILRKKEQARPKNAMHIMSEKERRELALTHMKQRIEAKNERRLYGEEMQAKRQRESAVYTSMMTDEEIRTKLLAILREEEYISTRDASIRLNVNEDKVSSILKKIGERQTTGKNIHKYKLLPQFVYK